MSWYTRAHTAADVARTSTTHCVTMINLDTNSVRGRRWVGGVDVVPEISPHLAGVASRYIRRVMGGLYTNRSVVARVVVEGSDGFNKNVLCFDNYFTRGETSLSMCASMARGKM